MGIQKDAGEVLVFIYQKKVAGEEIPGFDAVVRETGWDRNRALLATEYLVRKGLLMGQAVKTMGSTKTVFVHFHDVTPEGVDTVENTDKFRRNFNFGINLGAIQFSWGATER